MQTVLIAGGGPAALEAALALRALAPTRLRLVVVSPDPSWAYRPLTVLEPFAAGQPRAYPLDVLREHGVDLVTDAVLAVDAPGRTVETESGDTIAYDALLVATGAEYRLARPRATSAVDTNALHGLVQDVEGGYYKRIAFVAGHEARWTLPLYELVLQLAERVSDLSLRAMELSVYTHEKRPLEAFGTRASELVEGLLAEGDVALHPETNGAPEDVQRVVALPAPVGRAPRGLPATDRGFLPVDEYGRVDGSEFVYAAGDVTDHALKQGGLATQQADNAAVAIAADLGLREAIAAQPPVLRGVLIAGSRSFYLRRAPDDPLGSVSTHALWWPPTKIAGRYLSAFLDAIDADTGQTQAERVIEASSRARGARVRAIIGPRNR